MGFLENNVGEKMKKDSQGCGQFSPKHLLKAYRTLFCVLVLGITAISATAQSPGEWIPEGAAPNTQGQVENIVPDDEVVGAVHCIVTHPTDPDIMWVGAVNGGLWRTNNGSAGSPTWIRQSDSAMGSQRSLSISALDLDPTDAMSQTLVAGLGSVSSFLSISGDRNGILRTVDGGDTWMPLGTNELQGANISGVASRGSTIVVSVIGAEGGAQTGIWRSTDTGATFTRISTGTGATTGLPSCQAFYLEGDPQNNSRLFTATRAIQTGNNGIFRSDDTGANWVRVSDAAIEALMGNSSNVEIAVGNSNNVYVAIANNGRLAGLFRSGNGGTSWTSLDLPNPQIHPGGQAGIHMSIVADPTNVNLVYIGGDRQGSSVTGATDFSGNLWRVNAAAAPGSQAAHLTHSNSQGPAGGGTASGSSPHADSRDMAFDAAGNIIETDDGGIYRRTSPQDNTGDWFSIIGDLQTPEYHNVAYDANSNIIMGGAQDTGSSAQDAPGSLRWISVSTADGGDTVVDDISSPGLSTRFASFQNLGNFTRRVYDANNVLQSSTGVNLTPIGGSPGLGASFVTPLEINAVDGNRLLIMASNGTYESDDHGDTVTRISAPAVIDFGQLGADPLSYGAADNADIVYVGSRDRIFVRTGAPGTPVNQANSYPGTGTGRFVRDTVIDPSTGNNAFVVDPQRVFRTTDAGANWTDITGNIATLDGGELRSIEYIEHSDDDALVVGSDRGVFITRASDGFSTWEVMGTGLPNVMVMELEYDASDNILLAGLMGRGAFTMMEPLAGNPCPFDVSGDGIVSQADLDLLFGGWNEVDLDVDEDGIVTIRDLIAVLNGFGPCP